MNVIRVRGLAWRRIDHWLEVDDAPQLNWKGRTIERVLCAHRLVVRRVDRVLGVPWAPQLNWKGRAIERMLGVGRLMMLPAKRLVPPPAARLNWKGRLIERVYTLRRMIPGRFVRIMFLVTNEVCCAAYGVVGKLRRRDRVRSVLQLSIISHKQFMVSRALRRHGLKADYFALNVGASTGILDVGYDYSLPAGVSPRKRRLLEVYTFGRCWRATMSSTLTSSRSSAPTAGNSTT